MLPGPETGMAFLIVQHGASEPDLDLQSTHEYGFQPHKQGIRAITSGNFDV